MQPRLVGMALPLNHQTAAAAGSQPHVERAAIELGHLSADVDRERRIKGSDFEVVTPPPGYVAP